jgi:ABC-type maltose transport system permease subunit
VNTKKFCLSLITDVHGISHTKFLNVLIGISSVVLMWKMVLMHEMTDTAWGLWLAYGSGTAGWSSYLNARRKPEGEKE